MMIGRAHDSTVIKEVYQEYDGTTVIILKT